MPTVYELLNQCAVRIDTPAGPRGTGFFVAPGYVLTCAHVVEDAQHNPIFPLQIFWKNQAFAAEVYQLKSAAEHIDLALLKVAITDHPCVLLLGTAEPRNHLYSYGYPAKEPAGLPTTFMCEGWVGDQHEQLKFQLGQARPGMSGSPLLNEETGCVCAILQFTFDRSSLLGGQALLANVIFREFPELARLQQAFHEQDEQWLRLLPAGSPKHYKELLASAANAEKQPLEVFIIYTDEDEPARRELEQHLSSFEKQGLITIWHKRRIRPGQETQVEMERHFTIAGAFLLLVSADFIASPECHALTTRVMKRPGTKVIPIILRSCLWEFSNFGKLDPLPKDGKPVVESKNAPRAYTTVVKELLKELDVISP